MRFNYNQDVLPPAPFVPLHVAHDLYRDRSATLAAKLDTGADITVIPSGLVQTLGLSEAARYLVEGYDGRQTVLTGYVASLVVGGLSVGQVTVITAPGDYAILGRDVLNLLRIFLDGPALSLDIQA